MNMKLFVTISLFFSLCAFVACDDGKTYIELREEEDNAIEKYLTSDGRWGGRYPCRREFPDGRKIPKILPITGYKMKSICKSYR